MTFKQAADLFARVLDGTTTPEDAADLYIPPAAIDLHTVPRDQWVEHIGRPVIISAGLAAFINGQSEFTQEERDGLEDRITAHYGATEPFYITFEQGPPAEAWLGKEPLGDRR
jgi:hypothetical protein